MIHFRRMGFILLLSSLLASPVLAKTIEQPHIDVTGISKLQVKPDIAKISISVNAIKPTAKAAKKTADDSVAQLIKRLKGFNLSDDDISSANLNLSAEYRYPPKQERKLVGYRATRNITVSIETLNKVSLILDEAIESGINQVNDIQFDVKNRQKFLEQARTMAVKDAKNKAESLAKSVGERIKGVWEIRYHNGASSQPPLLKPRMMMAEMADADSGYQNSKVTFTDRVEVVFILQ